MKCSDINASMLVSINCVKSNNSITTFCQQNVVKMNCLARVRKVRTFAGLGFPKLRKMPILVVMNTIITWIDNEISKTIFWEGELVFLYNDCQRSTYDSRDMAHYFQRQCFRKHGGISERLTIDFLGHRS